MARNYKEDVEWLNLNISKKNSLLLVIRLVEKGLISGHQLYRLL